MNASPIARTLSVYWGTFGCRRRKIQRGACRPVSRHHRFSAAYSGHYFDPDSKLAKPRWLSRDVRFVERFAEVLSLQDLRQHGEALGPFHLLQRFNRLSVMPVSEAQWDYVLALAKRAAKAK